MSSAGSHAEWLRSGLRLDDCADGAITKVTIGETPMVLIRQGETVHALGAICPHAGAPMEDGAVCNGRLICPWHKSVFRLQDGALVEPPALDGLPCYPVRIDNGEIRVAPTPLPSPAPSRNRHASIAAIIGSGAAGAAAASALRYAGYDGRVMLIGPESLQPYDRTVLSKFVVAGEMQSRDLPPLRDRNDWHSLEVEQVDTTVTSLEATTRRLEFADGSIVTYDTALLAAGGVPKRPNIPGIDLEGVQTLRTAQDGFAIVAATGPGRPVVIMGSSFIGLEVASGLRKRGAEVTVVAPDAIPFARQFGDEIGAALRDLHEANGIIFRIQDEIIALDGREHVHHAVLKSGDRLAADSVVVGVGVSPATHFVKGVEKTKDGGIVVDAAMRAAGTLFVAGDCARFPLRGTQVRIEHWRVAQQHARVAAMGMMGKPARYEGVPFFWTYHYGKNIEYLGHAEQWDDLHIDGNLAARDFVAFQMRGGEVAGVIACGREARTACLIEAMRQPLSLAEARAVIARGSFPGTPSATFVR